MPIRTFMPYSTLPVVSQTDITNPIKALRYTISDGSTTIPAFPFSSTYCYSFRNTTTGDRLTIGTETDAADSGMYLSVESNYGSGGSNQVKIFTLAGSNGGGAGNKYTIASNTTTTSTIADARGNSFGCLTNATSTTAATNMYSAGAGGDGSKSITKHVLGTETSTGIGATLSVNMNTAACSGEGTKAYWFPCNSGSVCNKFTLATEACAAVATGFTTAVPGYGGAGGDGSTKGYLHWSATNSQKIVFSTDTTTQGLTSGMAQADASRTFGSNSIKLYSAANTVGGACVFSTDTYGEIAGVHLASSYRQNIYISDTGW